MNFGVKWFTNLGDEVVLSSGDQYWKLIREVVFLAVGGRMTNHDAYGC